MIAFENYSGFPTLLRILLSFDIKILLFHCKM